MNQQPAILSLSQQFIVCLALILGCAVNVEARVTRIVIEQIQSPAYEGRAFGAVGQYEILVGAEPGSRRAEGTRRIARPRDDRGRRMPAALVAMTLACVSINLRKLDSYGFYTSKVFSAPEERNVYRTASQTRL